MKHYKNLLILSTEFPPGPGGIGNHAFNLADDLKKRDVDVTVCTVSDYVTEANALQFDKVQKFTIMRFPRYKFPLKTYFYRIYFVFRLLRKNQFDVILCSGKFSIWMGWMIRKRYPKQKLVAVVHGSEVSPKTRFTRFLTHKSFSQFDEIISVSKFTQSLLPVNSNVKQKRVIIPNAIDPKKLLNSEQSISIPGSPIFLTVGSVSPRKGQLNFINTIPKIMKEYPNLHYHCVGKPLIANELFVIAEKLKISHKITFHGNVENSQLEMFYKQADIFIMLSQSQPDGDVEGFGIAILEANFFGVPAIGSKNCGIEDAIDNSKTGILVEPQNSEEIFDAVVKIISNREKFSKVAKKWANLHTWEIIGKQYFKVLFNE